MPKKGHIVTPLMTDFPVEDIAIEEDNYDHEMPNPEPQSEPTVKQKQSIANRKEWTIFLDGSHKRANSESDVY